MKRSHQKKTVAHLHRRIVTTVGDLVSAAYDCAQGSGRRRLEAAAQILTESPLARSLSRPVVFVR